ncbi:DUF2256 domain-containing protein [Arenicella sp. 4NH20-0111]|uniref:DUF2256 domain-containing protein n=1 Tax=Arenicella sp. 4NH20-0111 TaxID=3127648 RepID=UPI00333F7111
MTHKKMNLPSKQCQCCQRPFLWRKKWSKDWKDVKYCSKRCRSQRDKAGESLPND